MKTFTPKRFYPIAAALIVLSLLLTTVAFADDPVTTTVTVVSTNDFHGALVGSTHSWSHGDMVGGAEWVAGYLNVVRQENPTGVLYLDAGDTMQGTLISNYFYGASTIEAFNAMGVDAMAVGNHEFDWDQDVLKERSEEADFPFLAANIFYAKEEGNPAAGRAGRPKWAKPYVVQEVNGVNVGIIGIGNPDTPTVTNPAMVDNLVFTDPAAAVAEALPEAEGEGATMIVVLAHIGGFYPDFEQGLSQFVCGLDASRVDLVVSGHTHSRVDDVICGIPVVQAYSSGTAFARVDFTVDLATGEALNYKMNYSPTSTYQTYYGNPATYKRWDTGQRVPVIPDPDVAVIVDVFEAEIAAIKNSVVGCAASDVTRSYRYESEMGDWVTDILRAYGPGIDFAFMNSGGLRANLNTGDVTFGEIFEIMPFDNTLVLVELDGSEVRQVLEEGITGDHGVIQVSGLQFIFDYDAPAGSRIVGDVTDLSTGLPLDPAATYTVAVNDYMANGGSDFNTLPLNPRTNTYVLVRDLMVDWVKAAGCFNPPDPAVELRMIAIGTPPP